MCTFPFYFLFFFQCCAAHRDLHSFPTRRSSDLRPSRSSARADEPSKPGAPSSARRASGQWTGDRKSTRLNSSHVRISYAVFCLKKKKKKQNQVYNTAGFRYLILTYCRISPALTL